MTLNEKIGILLKKHKEGEDFFNALDFMIKGDRSILDDFYSFFIKDVAANFNKGGVGFTSITPDIGLIVSGSFGNAIMTIYGHSLTSTFKEVIITNGGIRLGKEATIFKDRLVCKNWVFIDDSYYMGRTRDGILKALQAIRPDASLCETYVIYDGSMGRVDKVKSMYRYNK